MFDLAEYQSFISSKGVGSPSRGFDMRGDWSTLFPHQRTTLAFACEKGRSAAFLDTGLGKSRVEAAAAEEFRAASGRPSLILTPLAVAQQMRRECEAVGVEARVVREAADVGMGVNIANYERVGKLDLAAFGGIVLDESSILKSFGGPTKTALVKAFSETPYRLAATATPAPNDHMELGNHSEFLGYLGSMEMLCRWFVNDTSTASQDWRLKGHAVDDFWSWVASWARAAALPSDLGGEDAGFILPPLNYQVHTVAADLTQDAGEGMLFRIPDQSATTVHREKRLTLADRVGRVVEIVTGSICDKLAANQPEAAQCRGSQNTQKHEGLNQRLTLNTGQSATLKETAQTQRSGPNTCESIAPKTLKNGSAVEKRKTPSTRNGANDTEQTLPMRISAANGQETETLPQDASGDCNQLTASAPTTTTPCLPPKAGDARSATESTRTNQESGCTSITATAVVTSGDCSAPRATRRLVKCATTQNGLGGRSFTYSAQNLEPWLVFCETNEEQDALEAAFGDLCISIRGADSVEKKERDIQRWLDGERPVFISKPRIVGYGLNFQQCNNVIFASISHSYEAFYQCVRRVWRFGQKRPVTAHVVISDTELPIWRNVQRKAADHDRMKAAMARAMVAAQRTASRKAYTRVAAVTLPKFVTGETL